MRTSTPTRCSRPGRSRREWMRSVSTHKLHGPKGVGCLVVRSGVRLEPFMLGGGHERNRRAGTENVAGIAELAKAVSIAQRDLEKNVAQLTLLRDHLLD